ncbi:MAG: type II toxin-antitoxin system HipA family toxin [Gammaproteobacteria bacterium]
MNTLNTNTVVVHAWLNGAYVPAGKLRLSGQQFEFWYGAGFLSNGYALDPIKLPLTETIYHANGLQGDLGVFADALPDSWGRYLIKQHYGQDVSELEILTLDCSSQRMGALFFSTELNDTPSDKIHSDEWMAIFSEWINDNNKTLPESLMLGSSAGGAKPKCLVRLDDREWIAKFQPANEITDKAAIEHGSLSLARSCGITAAESKLLILPNNQNVVLVKRFDRNNNNPIHYISANTICTVLKNETGAVSNDTRSYLILADNLSKISSQAVEDKRELFKRIIFNILIGNHDDHSKNHGIIRDSNNNWKLSPAFDLVAGEGGRELSMIIGPEYTKPSFNNLLQSIKSFGLNKIQAIAEIEFMLTKIKNWKTVFQDAAVPEKTINDIKWAIKDNVDVSKL